MKHFNTRDFDFYLNQYQFYSTQVKKAETRPEDRKCHLANSWSRYLDK